MDLVVTRARLALLPLALLTGCIFTDLRVIRPLSEPVGKVSLSVTSAPGVMTDAQAAQLRPALTSALASGGVRLAARGEPGVNELEGVVEEYKTGNRALRYFFGIVGAGVGRFRSDWRVKNAAGADIGECRVDGSIHNGSFGGSYNELLEAVGSKLCECLKPP